MRDTLIFGDLFEELELILLICVISSLFSDLFIYSFCIFFFFRNLSNCVKRCDVGGFIYFYKVFILFFFLVWLFKVLVSIFCSLNFVLVSICVQCFPLFSVLNSFFPLSSFPFLQKMFIHNGGNRLFTHSSSQ